VSPSSPCISLHCAGLPRIVVGEENAVQIGMGQFQSGDLCCCSSIRHGVSPHLYRVKFDCPSSWHRNYRHISLRRGYGSLYGTCKDFIRITFQSLTNPVRHVSRGFLRNAYQATCAETNAGNPTGPRIRTKCRGVVYHGEEIGCLQTAKNRMGEI